MHGTADLAPKTETESRQHDVPLAMDREVPLSNQKAPRETFTLSQPLDGMEFRAIKTFAVTNESCKSSVAHAMTMTR